jgi:cysteine synthase A
MSDRSKYYILGAFLLGIAAATAYNKRLAAEKNNAASGQSLLAQQQNLLLQLAKINDLDLLKKGLLEIERSLAEGTGTIKEGIEGCIGNTPLIKIKSLSEYTGCDILAKAEVCGSVLFINCPTDA